MTRVGAIVRRARGRLYSHASAAGPSAGPDQRSNPRIATNPVELIYELLDAHADTLDLAGYLSYDPDWAAHVEYLRSLQRTGARCSRTGFPEVRA
jgi:hypothetical protein